MSNDHNNFGVSRLSLVPMRTEPSDKAEQVSQLLFGDHYEVHEVSKDKNWLRIHVYYDQCEGWINAHQHHTVTREYYDYINRADFKITTDLTSSILYNKSPLLILIGSIIPISGSELFKMEEQFAFNGDSKSLGVKREAEFLKSIALKYLNAPYQWGGKSPFGIDASGLVQMVYKITGYRLGRTLEEQSRQGKAVNNLAEAVPGDLIFFTAHTNRNNHVGLLLEKDKIIHAFGKVRIDYLNEEGILNLDTKIYTHALTGIRRVLTE
ncbi:MAG TPA: SH3 domain-containing C40 family peptidase [Cyclobacteriaceae bacterium]|nr:SH3 domain-containing C40 family peptidase [Cyclobacteriaceae bacterium]HRJ83343.1 SH3 domain-containing C40 family peptidase [Cyclobacteriaceae bacterium]